MTKFITSSYVFQTNVKERVKFAFVSDLHDCANDPILAALQENAVDAVLVGGDFIHDYAAYARGLEFLRRASERFPVFCVLGNHELRFGRDLFPMLRNIPVTLLGDKDVMYRGVRLGGIDSSEGCTDEQNFLNFRFLQSFSQKDGFKILLCHHPEYYEPYLRRHKIDLILSGHAHGGQWRAFGRGLYAPGQGVFPKYTSGLYEERLLVGRGLGNHHRIPRINNKRELITVTIEPFDKG